MSQEPSGQREWSLGANFWWGTILSLILVVSNAAYLLLETARMLDANPNLGFLSSEGSDVLWYQYALVCFFGFLLVGLLRGHALGKIGLAIRISIAACLVSTLSLFALPLLLASVVRGEGALSLVAFTFNDNLTNIFVQWLAGIGGGVLGGLIGSRLRRRRPA